MQKSAYMPYALVSMSALCLSAAVVIALMNTASNKSALLNMNAQLDFITASFLTASNMLYGSVLSVDTAGMTIDFIARNPYSATGSPVRMKLRISENSSIVRQELGTSIPGSGSYDTLSSPQGIRLSDVRAGERAAILTHTYQNALVTDFVIVGNPL